MLPVSALHTLDLKRAHFSRWPDCSVTELKRYHHFQKRQPRQRQQMQLQETELQRQQMVVPA